MKNIINKSKWLLFTYAITSVLEILSEIGFAYFMKATMDFLTGKLHITIVQVILIGIISYLFKAFGTFVNDINQQRVVTRIMYRYKRRFMKAILRQI